MVCKIRYLSSAGLQSREVPGITELASAFPSEWLFYTSLQCYPKDERPIEIDAMVVMDDRVLLMELKDYHGDLSQNGYLWLHGTKRRFQSPVDKLAMKARKVKSFLNNAIPGFNKFEIDSRVVLTGTATKDKLTSEEQSKVWSLKEAASIGARATRQLLLPPFPFGLKRVPLRYVIPGLLRRRLQFQLDLRRVIS